MKRLKQALIISALFSIIIYSCKSDDENGNSNNNVDTNTVEVKDNPLNLSVQASETGNYVIGDKIEVSINDSKIENTDTVKLYINGEELTQFTDQNLTFVWDSKQTKTGNNLIEIELNKEENRFRKQTNVLLLSDIVPEKFGYKVKKVFKHDVKAYTQGLFYHDGYLYEATGLKGESTVRKVKLETGEVIQSFAISKDIFGEGIVLFEDKIIQLSWEAGKGYVYDFTTFKRIDEFSYIGEGWGICTDGEKLFMTNGTNKISILEPQSYSEIATLEVYDNEKQVQYLNELEYINGYIYANIYNYDDIVKIDPKTGKVIAFINLKGILPMNDYNNKTDVLNGIAYDKDKNRIFITGKNWPKLFEIEPIIK